MHKCPLGGMKRVRGVLGLYADHLTGAACGTQPCNLPRSDPIRGSGQGAEDPEADTGGGAGSGGPDSRTTGQAARLRVVTDSPVRDKARFSSWLILCPVCSPSAVL